MNRLPNCFFKVLEDEIESKWDNIECKDVYELYFDFCKALKEETGSATGFTGLSEVIIFMILKKIIEKEYGKLEAHEYTKDTRYLSNSKFAIGRGLRISIGKWKNPSKDLKREPPDRAIEIKVYTVERGEKTVGDAINRLKSIRAAKSSFKGMLIFYSRPSKFNEIKDIFDKEKDWLTWIVLKDNCENFVEILRAWLEQSNRQV